MGRARRMAVAATALGCGATDPGASDPLRAEVVIPGDNGAMVLDDFLSQRLGLRPIRSGRPTGE